MAAILYLFVFSLCGCAIAHFLLPRIRPVARIWLGLCLGILLMMWLPFLVGFAFDFTLKAHLLALIPLALLTAGTFFIRDKHAARQWDEDEKRLCISMLCVALPLTLIGAYLQHTHNIRPAADGSLHVGQSTYGDLNLHLGIITSMRNAALPADYSIFPGAQLSYPFLMDSFSTSFMLFGASLRFSVVFPGIYMMALTFCGYMILSRRMADTKGGAILATLLFFLNGGLGFLYVFDMQGVATGAYGDGQLQSAAGLLNRIRNVLSGWYQAPTNHTEFTTYNLRWSNVICDMMIPQRTILGGWCQLLPCMFLLYDALCPEQGLPCQMGNTRRYSIRQMALLGVMAGGMPLLHTHSFLALGLMSAGFMLYDLCHAGKEWKNALLSWMVYALVAVVLAAPQLFTWTFKQATGSDSFLSFHFNWVNNSYSQGLRDGYLWFYVKNVGLPFILLLLALLEKNPKRRFLACGAFAIFIVAEFIQFQPNEYDNNKLFYVWYMLCAVIVGDYMVELYHKLRGIRARNVMAIITLFVCFASALLTIAREWVSDYQTFSRQDVEAAEFIEANTDKDAVFITWTQHINPVSALTGRTIVCGPALWLSFHGLDISQRTGEIYDFYMDPAGKTDTLEKYGVDYIFVSSYERANCYVNTEALDEHFEKVFESSYGDISIYAVE